MSLNLIENFALTMLKNNPKVSNDARAKELITIIENGDSNRGIEIANNYCNTYGVSRENALTQAKSFFGIH